MKIKQSLILVILLLIAGTAWGGAYIIAQTQNITFDDPNLEHAVREELQLPDSEPITHDHVQATTTLDLSNQQISNVTGLGVFNRLTALDLSENKIEDLSPLADLERLDTLTLTGNRITDLEPIAGLSTLTSLNVRENYIETLEPIAELIHLTELNIRENRIESLQPLLAMEQLEDLNARYNNIIDIEPVLDLPMLRERLYIEGNPIENITVLTDLYDEVQDIDVSRPEYHIDFSADGAVYQQAQTVEINTLGNAAGVIHYTVDGTTVDEDSPVYEGPLKSQKAKPSVRSFSQKTGTLAPKLEMRTLLTRTPIYLF
ncbi:leucine-rich repeat domain-containing protein [Geomicrobium sp. JCM 19039]|uniref:leucine-rich repeat domain-containing protein n=1 Tax=Geomicrobium sp. JCM 19039 TaxID=1460636 RepID=UPI00045F1E8A|nr:leucine-rich repeat domain-containing protein [Geomicrobium sp. JCM 19039]GAK11623.1 Rab family protein [Geomicrobium sp. JCM 19039]